MRGENVRPLLSALFLILILLVIVSCNTSSTSKPAPMGKVDTRPERKRDEPKIEPERKPVVKQERKEEGNVIEPTWRPRIKGNGPEDSAQTARRNPRTARTINDDPVAKMQERRVAEKPFDETEVLKLAALFALNGKYVDAEGLLMDLRHRTHKLIPFLEAYIYRKLGEHREEDDFLDPLGLGRGPRRQGVLFHPLRPESAAASHLFLKPFER